MSSLPESQVDFIEVVACMLTTYQYESEHVNPQLSPAEFVKKNFCEKQLFVNKMQEKCVATFFEICSLQSFLEEIIKEGGFAPTTEKLINVYFLMFYVSPTNIDDIIGQLIQNFGLEMIDQILKYLTRQDLLSTISEKCDILYPSNERREAILKDVEERIPMYHQLSENLEYVKTSCKSPRSFKMCDIGFEDANQLLLDYNQDPHSMRIDLEESIWSPRNTTQPSLESKTKSMSTYRANITVAPNKQGLKKVKVDLSLPLGQNTETKRVKTLKKIQEEPISFVNTPHSICTSTARCSKAPLPEIKKTTAQVLREGARVRKKAVEAEKLLKDLCTGAADPLFSAKLVDDVRQEENAIELRHIEKKHLLGLLSHEEVRIARSALLKANRKKALELKRQSQELEKQLQEWRRQELIRMRQIAERNQCTVEQARLAQANLLDKKRQTAKQIQEESREIQRQIDNQKKRELDQKIALIRQIKELEQLSKSSTAKDYGLNCSDTRSQTSSIGVSCQMSIIQLKEALANMREKIREQVEKRREKIQFEHFRQQMLLQDNMRRIERYKNVPKPNKAKVSRYKEISFTPDLIKLRKKLELKRLQAASAGNF